MKFFKPAVFLLTMVGFGVAGVPALAADSEEVTMDVVSQGQDVNNVDDGAVGDFDDGEKGDIDEGANEDVDDGAQNDANTDGQGNPQ